MCLATTTIWHCCFLDNSKAVVRPATPALHDFLSVTFLTGFSSKGVSPDHNDCFGGHPRPDRACKAVSCRGSGCFSLSLSRWMLSMPQTQDRRYARVLVSICTACPTIAGFEGSSNCIHTPRRARFWRSLTFRIGKIGTSVGVQIPLRSHSSSSHETHANTYQR